MEEHISHKAFIPWRFLTVDCVLSFSLAPTKEIIDILIACRSFFSPHRKLIMLNGNQCNKPEATRTLLMKLTC